MNNFESQMSSQTADMLSRKCLWEIQAETSMQERRPGERLRFGDEQNVGGKDIKVLYIYETIHVSVV